MSAKTGLVSAEKQTAAGQAATGTPTSAPTEKMLRNGGILKSSRLEKEQKQAETRDEIERLKRERNQLLTARRREADAKLEQLAISVRDMADQQRLTPTRNGNDIQLFNIGQSRLAEEIVSEFGQRIAFLTVRVAELESELKGDDGDSLAARGHECLEELSAIDMLEAAQSGDFDAVEACLDDGIDPNTAEDSGRTALHFASNNGHLDIVKLLLERGADVDALNNSGQTPLLLASYLGHRDVVIQLIRYEANVNRADPVDGSTPLHCASYSGKLSTLLTLIQSGADVNLRDKYGKTPLMRASETKITQALLERGAIVNHTVKKGPALAQPAADQTKTERSHTPKKAPDTPTSNGPATAAQPKSNGRVTLKIATDIPILRLPEDISRFEESVSELTDELFRSREDLESVQREKEEREAEIERLKSEKNQLMKAKKADSEIVSKVEQLEIQFRDTLNKPRLSLTKNVYTTINSVNYNHGENSGAQNYHVEQSPLAEEIETKWGERIVFLTRRITELESELKKKDRQVDDLKLKVSQLREERNRKMEEMMAWKDSENHYLKEVIARMKSEFDLKSQIEEANKKTTKLQREMKDAEEKNARDIEVLKKRMERDSNTKVKIIVENKEREIEVLKRRLSQFESELQASESQSSRL